MENNILEKYVRTIKDFPKEGVFFRDVTGILDSGEGFRLAMVEMERALGGVDVDKIVAPESRGFIFGAALADRLRCAFVPLRKPGKLPRETISETYELEYCTATLHIHKDAVSKGDRVVLVDDLLATGGTAKAGAKLVERLGGKVVKMLFPIELAGFGAVDGALAGYDVFSLIRYPGK
ncbi:MAG: adenine phosphoribosyltransferase [Kiritimatiellae bacterium]|nr:adenine phosphoribosyltransferase [Kiritimatiellia bacterium]